MSIPLVGFEVSQARAIGPNPATTLTTTFTTLNTGSHVKSAWTQIVAATDADIDWLLFKIQMEANNVSKCIAVDIAIGGAGSEIIIIPNVVLGWSGSTNGSCFFALPISIPSGSRIAFRWQEGETGATNTYRLSLYGFTGNFDAHVSKYDCLGFDASNTRGVQIQPSGTANVAGSWAEIISATARDYSGLIVVFDSHDTNFNAQIQVDVAIGAGGSEVIILPDIQMHMAHGMTGCYFGFIPMFIPAGTRIAARMAVNTTDFFVTSGVTILGAVG